MALNFNLLIQLQKLGQKACINRLNQGVDANADEKVIMLSILKLIKGRIFYRID